MLLVTYSSMKHAFILLAFQHKFLQIRGYLFGLGQILAWNMWQVLRYQVVPNAVETVTDLLSLLYLGDGWAFAICGDKESKGPIFQARTQKRNSTISIQSLRIFLQRDERIEMAKTYDGSWQHGYHKSGAIVVSRLPARLASFIIPLQKQKSLKTFWVNKFS
jgi:hypothetical protein